MITRIHTLDRDRYYFYVLVLGPDTRVSIRVIIKPCSCADHWPVAARSVTCVGDVVEGLLEVPAELRALEAEREGRDGRGRVGGGGGGVPGGVGALRVGLVHRLRHDPRLLEQVARATATTGGNKRSVYGVNGLQG